jgi:hypothetical protein
MAKDVPSPVHATTSSCSGGNIERSNKSATDQLPGLEARDVTCCAALNGLLSMPGRADVLDRVRMGVPHRQKELARQTTPDVGFAGRQHGGAAVHARIAQLEVDDALTLIVIRLAKSVRTAGRMRASKRVWKLRRVEEGLDEKCVDALKCERWECWCWSWCSRETRKTRVAQ